METIGQHGVILVVVSGGPFQQLQKLSDQIEFANKRIAGARDLEAKPFGNLWHYPGGAWHDRTKFPRVSPECGSNDARGRIQNRADQIHQCKDFELARRAAVGALTVKETVYTSIRSVMGITIPLG